ncbi:MAG: ATP-binding protein, partial [Bacteroidales bacterium]
VNKKAMVDLGYSSKELLGQSFIKKLVMPKKQKKTWKQMEHALNKEQAAETDSHYYFSSVNGKEIILDARNIRILDKKDNIKGILISGKDISGYLQDRSDLKKDINLYRALVNNLPEINLYLFNDKMEFILAEGTEMKNNNLSHEDFEGKHLSEIPATKLIKIWEPLFIKALKGEHIRHEYSLNNYHYLIMFSPVKDINNRIISCVAITRNITNQKRNEKSLKRSKEEAERSNEAKNLFLARVSHEIRTPLNAILGFTEQLKQTELDKTQQNYLDIIDESSEHLLSLIDDILVLSKIEAQQIRFEENPFKLNYIINYVIKSLSSRAKEKNLNLRFKIDPNLDKIMLGDSFRLQQILINLVSNAIKFTNSGYIELRSELEKELDDTYVVHFDVEDTGIGIPEKNLKKIFKNYRQANYGINKRYGGTGLGLSICKSLIELQDGTLSVTSREGEGSVFSFKLPFKKGKENSILKIAESKINPETLKDINCLLVDDDKVNRLLGATILKKMNCSFDIAKNGEEAISLYNKNNYDIILLDIHMHGINGMDVAQHIRSDKKDKKTKIIALTAAALKKDILAYYKVGMNDFLIKPFKEINLFSKICEVLNIKTDISKKSKAEIILKNELSPKPYSLADLKKMSGNDKSFMDNMLNTFIENSENAIQSFQKNLKNKNWEEIGETAHKILPS